MADQGEKRVRSGERGRVDAVHQIPGQNSPDRFRDNSDFLGIVREIESFQLFGDLGHDRVAVRQPALGCVAQDLRVPRKRLVEDPKVLRRAIDMEEARHVGSALADCLSFCQCQMKQVGPEFDDEPFGNGRDEVDFCAVRDIVEDVPDDLRAAPSMRLTCFGLSQDVSMRRAGP